MIGPAYVDIAAKYPLNDENVNHLADKIIAGGKGVWGEVPMTPHSALSKDDAKKMVSYILSLKNKTTHNKNQIPRTTHKCNSHKKIKNLHPGGTF